jgi:hypothetical protein
MREHPESTDPYHYTLAGQAAQARMRISGDSSALVVTRPSGKGSVMAEIYTGGFYCVDSLLQILFHRPPGTVLSVHRSRR